MGDSSEALYDVIVVGAGVEGSATAYHLARAGQRTLLLEQFSLPHTRGSSHGATRITRKAYTKSLYANMMVEAYRKWEELARQAQAKLFEKTGLLFISQKGENSPVAATEKALSDLRAVYRSLDATQLRKEYPMLSFPDDHCAVFDPDAGILMADKCVEAFQSQFKKYGGVIHDAEPVTSVTPGDTVTIITNKSRYSGRRVVLTAGPWSSRLLRPLGLNLPLKPVKINVCYWADKQDGCYASDSGCPVIIYSVSSTDIYGLPSLEYPGQMKVCYHDGPEIDPDKRDFKSAGDVDSIAEVSKFVKNHMPGLEDKPSIVESCIYTFTPDEDFILDTHPSWKNIVIGAGFSGHGFKLAPVVGKVLGELAMGRVTSYDLSQFRINRFFPGLDNAKL